MACVNGVKPLKKKKNKEIEVQNIKMKEKPMSATMVR